MEVICNGSNFKMQELDGLTEPLVSFLLPILSMVYSLCDKNVELGEGWRIIKSNIYIRGGPSNSEPKLFFPFHLLRKTYSINFFFFLIFFFLNLKFIFKFIFHFFFSFLLSIFFRQLNIYFKIYFPLMSLSAPYCKTGGHNYPYKMSQNSD